MTRKSTPKYEIVTIDTGTVVYGPASKTECNNIARGMNIKGRKQSVEVRSSVEFRRDQQRRLEEYRGY